MDTKFTWRHALMGVALSCLPLPSVKAQSMPMLPPAPVAPAAPSAPGGYDEEVQDPRGQTDGSAQPHAGYAMPFHAPDDGFEGPSYQSGSFPEDEPTAHSDPPGRVGRVRVYGGKVSIQPAGEKVWLDASTNRPITSGDALWVADGGRGQVHVGGISLHLGPGTLLRFTTLDDDTLQLGLTAGAVHVHLRESPIHSLVEVDLEGMSSTLQQAGDYLLEAGKNGAEALTVRRGRAEVLIDTDHIAVGTAQRLSHNHRGGRVRKLTPAGTPGALEVWSTHNDAAQAAVPALHYISQDTVGYEDLDGHGVWEPTAEYGTVWRPTQLAAGWAPYRYGHWSYILPWGWTWVDDASWGFAPFHYGRWVHCNDAWAWAPGNYMHRPIYAPHLVTFLGPQGASMGVSLGMDGGMVAWVPLGFGEPFMPGYPSSYYYMRGINGGRGPVMGGGQRQPHFVHGQFSGAITAVPQGYFGGGRPIGGAQVAFGPQAVRGNMFGAPGPGIAPNVFRPYGVGHPSGAPRPPPNVQHPFPPSRFSPFMGRRGTQQVPGMGPTFNRMPPAPRMATPLFMAPKTQGQMMHFTGPSANHFEPHLMGHPVHPSVGHPAFYGHTGGPGYMGGGGHGPIAPLGRSRR